MLLRERNPLEKKLSIILAGKVLAILLSLTALPSAAYAQSLVTIETALGEFKVQLYDNLAPNTVARFTSDIEAGKYHFTYLHFAANSFFVGGRYTFDSCSQGPQEVNFGTAQPAEPTGLANATGTIAMVRNSNNPAVLTGEYLVNLGNNVAQDQDTAPIVIGEIVEGLSVADEIIDLWRVPLDPSPAVPTLNYDGNFTVECGAFNRDNLVQVIMSVEQSAPVNNFDSAAQRIALQVDAGSVGLLALQLTVVQDAPQVVIQVVPESVAALSATVNGMATYDAASETLTIPELGVDGVVTYSNLVLKLTDANLLQFTLQSVTQN